jgi:hypothetical protein
MLDYILRFMLWLAIFFGLFGFAFLFMGNFHIASNLLLAGAYSCFLGYTISYVSDKRRKSK